MNRHHPKSSLVYVTRLATALLAIPLVMGIGCSNSEKVDQVMLGHRKALLSETEPENFTKIGDAQQTIDQSPTITIQGQVDLEELTSEKPRALFLVREILDDDSHGDSSHDPSTCPFCRRRQAAAPKAVVVFRDEQGEVIPYNVDKLFSIKQGDVVVVQGQGKLDKGLNLFEVTANSIYVRP